MNVKVIFDVERQGVEHATTIENRSAVFLLCKCPAAAIK
jgi:hypothetical protein